MLLWSDPVEDIQGLSESPRGAGMLFGVDVTRKILQILGVKCLIRGHEPVQEGYRYNHGGKILTLFSRKGSPYFNPNAAYLHYNFSSTLNNAYDLNPFLEKF
jgi:protein phosphatase